MGYYTYFKLRASKNKEDICFDTDATVLGQESKMIAQGIVDYWRNCEKINSPNVTDEELDRYYPYATRLENSYVSEEDYDYLEDLFMDSMKWYEHEGEMCEISKLFPDYYFCLHGDGEEYDDIWKEYYHNGECVRAQGYIEVYYEEPYYSHMFKDDTEE